MLYETVGTTSCSLAQGEEMGYVEVELTDARGATSRVTFDSHGYRDLVSYRKRRLGRAEQRRLFGKAIAAPTTTRSRSDESVNAGVFWVMMMLVIMIVIIAIAQHADGSGSSGLGGGSDDVVRPVYGGGGGGVGK